MRRETTFWLLDEPMFRDDYLVLSMFSELTREGFRGAVPVQVDFRVDCSRVEEVHGMFNNVDLFVGSTGNLREFRRLKDDQDLSYIRQPSGRPRTWWIYGGTCRPSDLPVANRAWAIDTFLAGFDGLLPWLAYGGDEAWDSAEAAENAVFYPAAKRWDYDGCYGSLRMKAFRDGQQDAEYLRLLCQHEGVTRRNWPPHWARFSAQRARSTRAAPARQRPSPTASSRPTSWSASVGCWGRNLNATVQAFRAVQ